MNFIIEKLLSKPPIYNDNRLVKYTPIIPSNPIIIDEDWFVLQTNNLKKDLYELSWNFQSIKLQKIYSEVISDLQ